MSHAALFYTVGFGIFIVALLFCHAYGISNIYIYYPLAVFLGYMLSMKLINYLSPTAFDPAPAPVPKTRQERRKATKDAETFAKRNEKNARIEADASRKIVESRQRN
ncbi:hypothetical protein B0O80DRAFT_209524 [Mortierella sp. GBAus27b]|nr:hypothetical protein BGX31_005362 [Mortierella sp. GBA43]KAI8347719.1 hypothetical protein B0O80DRAFT_209524 [Mortierella sp. GBAus27b]